MFAHWTKAIVDFFLRFETSHYACVKNFQFSLGSCQISKAAAFPRCYHWRKLTAIKCPLAAQYFHRNRFYFLVVVIERLRRRSFLHSVITAWSRKLLTPWEVFRRRKRLCKNTLTHSRWYIPVAMPTRALGLVVFAWHSSVSIYVRRSRFFNQRFVDFILRIKHTSKTAMKTTVAIRWRHHRRVVNFDDHGGCLWVHVYKFSFLFIIPSLPCAGIMSQWR